MMKGCELSQALLMVGWIPLLMLGILLLLLLVASFGGKIVEWSEWLMRNRMSLRLRSSSLGMHVSWCLENRSIANCRQHGRAQRRWRNSSMPISVIASIGS